MEFKNYFMLVIFPNYYLEPTEMTVFVGFSSHKTLYICLGGKVSKDLSKLSSRRVSLNFKFVIVL